MIEFKAWPKISRLFRDVVITEKIDGTNAAIGIQEFQFGWHVGGTDDDGISHDIPENATLVLGPLNADDGLPVYEYLVYAQSRKRVITPHEDNHGFATWVWEHADSLVHVLGGGIHYGEWWGSGINRGYGLPSGEHRFSLFNTSRWGYLREPVGVEQKTQSLIDVGLDVVPILYQGEFSTLAVKSTMEQLRLGGSEAAPQFMQPEGIVVFHTAANAMFKATLENDEMPKVLAVAKSREIRDARLAEVSLDYDSPYEQLALAA
jgi:hypothetical protein